jgi:predicted transposase/invertase (TIGR01784 family)
MKPLLPTNDFVFKKVFGENRRILEDFLKSVLDLPPDEFKGLTVMNPDLEQEFIDDKLGVLDVKVNLRSGKVIDVEMQVRHQASIWQRMNFYTSKMVVEQLKSGFSYDKINRVISILIADFVMVVESAAYHHRFRLYDEKNGVRFPDSDEINTLELPKISETDITPLGNWLHFFKARTEEDFMNAAEKNPAIDEAWGIIKILSGDERQRALAESREKYHHDMASCISDGRRAGLQEGRMEGVQEEKLNVALTALGDNIPHTLIAKLTGLSIEEIERLAAEIKH